MTALNPPQWRPQWLRSLDRHSLWLITFQRGMRIVNDQIVSIIAQFLQPPPELMLITSHDNFETCRVIETVSSKTLYVHFVKDSMGPLANINKGLPGEVAGSPIDCQWLAFSESDTLRVFNGCTGRYLELQTTDYINCLVFSPDGNHLVVGFRDEGLFIVEVDLRTGTLHKKRVGNQTEFVDAMAFSPSGDRLAVWDECLHFYDANYVELVGDGQMIYGGSVLDIADLHLRMHGMSYSPSGDSLVAFGCDGYSTAHLLLYNIACHEVVLFMQSADEMNIIRDSVYVPSGTFSVTVGTGCVLRVETDSGERCPLHPRITSAECAAFTPDGTYLTISDGQHLFLLASVSMAIVYEWGLIDLESRVLFLLFASNCRRDGFNLSVCSNFISKGCQAPGDVGTKE